MTTPTPTDAPPADPTHPDPHVTAAAASAGDHPDAEGYRVLAALGAVPHRGSGPADTWCYVAASRIEVQLRHGHVSDRRAVLPDEVCVAMYRLADYPIPWNTAAGWYGYGTTRDQVEALAAKAWTSMPEREKIRLRAALQLPEPPARTPPPIPVPTADAVEYHLLRPGTPAASGEYCKTLTDRLNALGRDGWNLVAVVANSTWVLSRPVRLSTLVPRRPSEAPPGPPPPPSDDEAVGRKWAAAHGYAPALERHGRRDGGWYYWTAQTQGPPASHPHTLPATLMVAMPYPAFFPTAGAAYAALGAALRRVWEAVPPLPPEAAT